MTESKNVHRPAPYSVHLPRHRSLPFVFASPHSGRFYPPEFRRMSRLDDTVLRRSEDFFVDQLFETAPQSGAPLIAGEYARAYLDLNRSPDELDPSMFDEPPAHRASAASERVAAGLGIIPRVVASGTAIYSRRIPLAEAESRIRDIYRPYHETLGRMLADTRQQFGWAALIDCHSMPAAVARQQTRKGVRIASRLAPGRGDIDIVIGDRFGRSCSGRLSDFVEGLLRDLGYRTARNHPYSGGYCAVRYGQPDQGLHALQLEISRAVYLNESTFQPTSGFKRLQRDMGQLVQALALLDLGYTTPQAAE